MNLFPDLPPSTPDRLTAARKRLDSALSNAERLVYTTIHNAQGSQTYADSQRELREARAELEAAELEASARKP